MLTRTTKIICIATAVMLSNLSYAQENNTPQKENESADMKEFIQTIKKNKKYYDEQNIYIYGSRLRANKEDEFHDNPGTWIELGSVPEIDGLKIESFFFSRDGKCVKHAYFLTISYKESWSEIIFNLDGKNERFYNHEEKKKIVTQIFFPNEKSFNDDCDDIIDPVVFVKLLSAEKIKVKITTVDGTSKIIEIPKEKLLDLKVMLAFHSMIDGWHITDKQASITF